MATPKKSTKKASSGKVQNTQSKRAGLTMPVAKIGKMIRKAKYTSRVSAGAAVFIAGVLEYLTGETLAMASKLCKNKQRITPRAICLAVRNDEELGSLLANVTIARGGVAVTGGAKKEKKAKKGKKASKKAAKGEKKASKKTTKKSGAKKTKKAAKKE